MRITRENLREYFKIPTVTLSSTYDYENNMNNVELRISSNFGFVLDSKSALGTMDSYVECLLNQIFEPDFYFAPHWNNGLVKIEYLNTGVSKYYTHNGGYLTETRNKLALEFNKLFLATSEKEAVDQFYSIILPVANFIHNSKLEVEAHEFSVTI